MTDTGAGTTRTANLIAATATFVGVTLFTYRMDVRTGAVLGVTAGGLLGAITLITRSDSTLSTVVATALIPVCAVLSVASLGMAILESGGLRPLLAGSRGFFSAELLGPLIVHIGLTLGVSAATYGLITTVSDGLSEGALLSIWKHTVFICLLVGAALAGLLAFRLDALSKISPPGVSLDALGGLLLTPIGRRVLQRTTSSVSAGLLLTAVEGAAAAVLLSRSLTALPIIELASRTHREQLRATIDRMQAGLRRLALLSVGAGVITIGAVQAGWLAILSKSVPLVEPLLVTVLSPTLRTPLLGIICICSLTISLSYIIQQITGDIVTVAQQVVPAAASAGAVIMGAMIGSPIISLLLTALPDRIRPQVAGYVQAASPVGTVLLIIELAILVLAVVLVMIIALGLVGYVPSRATGGAIASTGLVTCSLIVGIFAKDPLLVFSGVALAIIVWDTSEYGVTTRTELGTRGGVQVTVLHSVGTIAVGLLAIGIAWSVESRVVASLAVPRGALTGILILVPALLLFLTVLRG
jgi:hypothetical protein